MYIYIMGRGHSGSTVLDILLGSSPAIESVGEVVSGLSRFDRERCACGAAMASCAFWGEVRSRVEAQGVSWAELCSLSVGQIDMVNLWRTARAGAEDDGMRRLLTATQALEHAVLAASGKQHVVDSNKAVTRALFLLRYHPEARVLHLVRSPFGVVQSHFWRVQARHPLFFQRMRLTARWLGVPYLLLSVVSWVVGNGLAELVARVAPDRVIRVRYEDLRHQPETELARIGTALGLDLSRVQNQLAADKPLSVGHNVGGNVIRTEGMVTFHSGRSSERPALPRWLKMVILAVCWPLMVRYGYRSQGLQASNGLPSSS